MKHKELTAYQIIREGDESTRAFQTDTEETGASVGIELQGNDCLSLGRSFLFWFWKTSEIVYRQDNSKKAFLIFSRLSGDSYFRADDVLGPIIWSDQELQKFSDEQTRDAQQEITIQLDTLLNESRDRSGAHAASISIADFLRKIYAIHPKKELVRLEGVIPPYLFLLVLDWFAGESRHILYQNESLL